MVRYPVDAVGGFRGGQARIAGGRGGEEKRKKGRKGKKEGKRRKGRKDSIVNEDLSFLPQPFSSPTNAWTCLQILDQ
jgi:hypothetical protein